MAKHIVHDVLAVVWTKTPFLRSIGKSNVEPNKTPARIAIEKPNIAFMRFARSEASAPRSPCFSVGFCTFCPSSMSGKSPHEAAVEASEFTFFISTSRAGSKSSNADAREKKINETDASTRPTKLAHGCFTSCSFGKTKKPEVACDPSHEHIAQIPNGEAKAEADGLDDVWAHQYFPASTWPHQAAAKGSKAGISTFGVEVRNIPVTKPTRRIPTDIAAEKKIPITNVTTLHRQVVHCETDASNQATGISEKEICRHEL